MLTLAEELLLIALDDEEGKVRSRTWGSTLVHPILERGLFGALLIELAFRGRLELRQEHLAVVDPSPTGIALLDETLAILERSREARTAQGWIVALGKQLKGLERRMLEGLVQQGILREEEGRILWVFPTKRHPTEDPGPERGVRERLSAVLAGEAPDQRTLLLLRLILACKLVELISTWESHRDVEARIRALRGEPGVAASVAEATARQIEDELTLILTSVTASAASH